MMLAAHYVVEPSWLVALLTNDSVDPGRLVRHNPNVAPRSRPGLVSGGIQSWQRLLPALAVLYIAVAACAFCAPRLSGNAVAAAFHFYMWVKGAPHKGVARGVL